MNAFSGRYPWQTDSAADSVVPERRPRDPKRSDEMVRSVLARLRLPSEPPRWRERAETWRILWMGRRLRKMDEADIVALVLAQRGALLARGLKGRPLAQVVAGVREICFRRLGMRHHPVQITGGLALLRGRIVEMATGEGKTITSLIPAVVAALVGQPVHIVTVNNYLAARDEENLRPVLEAFGLRSGCIVEDTPHEARPAIYSADVVFTTNKDIAFDYLRDRIAVQEEASALGSLAVETLAGHRRDSTRRLRRGLGFAIVDEIDSILIDEAQTPLIITAESPEAGAREAEEAELLLEAARGWVEGRDFVLDRKRRTLRVTRTGERRIIDMAAPVPGLAPVPARRERMVQALNALHLYNRDEHYILTEEGVAIVDEFTGRVMADRQWQQGLHQLIEAKEAVEASSGRRTIAQITYQAFFARYLWFSGMTGTAREIARELQISHGRHVKRLPTHRKIRRRNHRTRLYGSSEARWKAIVREVKRMQRKGRPVLLGTRSVSASETLSSHLSAAGIDHDILNARQDADEAAVISRAGQAGTVTVATNMAGRGTDIPVPRDVEAKGGLHVILSEFHGSARIDRQFVGRSARQGQRGSAIAIVSLEDELFLSQRPGLTYLFRVLTFARKGELPGWMAETLRLAAQWRAERIGRKRRHETVWRARRLAHSLGFRPDNI